MTYQFDNLRNLNILIILFLKYQKGENIFTKLIAKFLSSKIFFYLVYMLTSGFRSCNFQLWEFSKLSYSQQAILNLNQYIWWETIGFIIYRLKFTIGLSLITYHWLIYLLCIFLNISLNLPYTTIKVSWLFYLVIMNNNKQK